MPDSRSPLVSGWIAKAEEDLQVARLLIAQERRHLSVAVYHCQQSAEKALKAWLTAHAVIFPKSHDLELLVHRCVQSGGDFVTLEVAARELTPLATEFRYPGDVSTPSWAEAQQALMYAEEVFRHVIKRL